MSENFKPIISNKKKKSSLQSKKVEIQGKTAFGRTSSNAPKNNLEPLLIKKEITAKPIEKDKRFLATLTQKVSPSVNLKMNTLKPFLGELENMPKATINEIVDLVIDSYVNTRLSTRQQEAFKAMYDTQLKMLKK
ncbi:MULTISPECIES: hypothetical protein [Bacilli]|uniref:hypothetical protein n=1 Tax=Bacilli TaxID=91061 RepID=UPI001593DB33|nr:MULTISPECIES: hypothetical protein [Bacilli]HED9430959.1 hypothetical protein [Enterococcus faecium]MDT2604869.1 hypothetical protein [Enterococcus dongliensis]MDT2635297.1 hypothetical protein [Enterococcus dongliensis]MDT2823127.1 hypothetical protein [Enterococcus devriesei]NVE20749.1 hypothetical protein [Staphylococcus aureus]